MRRKGLNNNNTKKLSNLLIYIYRYDQSKNYIETLIEAFPCAIELWIELLVNPEISQNITEVSLKNNS